MYAPQSSNLVRNEQSYYYYDKDSKPAINSKMRRSFAAVGN
jgi:hypothetical protein